MPRPLPGRALRSLKLYFLPLAVPIGLVLSASIGAWY